MSVLYDLIVIGGGVNGAGVARDAAGKLTHHYVIADFSARWVSGEAKAASDITETPWLQAGKPAAAAVIRSAGPGPWTESGTFREPPAVFLSRGGGS